MKQLIRLNTFETNSSSAHTFIVSKDQNLPEKRTEHISIKASEYGRAYQRLRSFQDKLNYIFIHAIFSYEDFPKFLSDFLKYSFPNLKTITVNGVKHEIDPSNPFWIETWLEQNDNFLRNKAGFYLDYQSHHILPKDKEALDYLLHSSGVILTGSDENWKIFKALVKEITKRKKITKQELYLEYKQYILDNLNNREVASKEASKEKVEEFFNNYEKGRKNISLIDFENYYYEVDNDFYIQSLFYYIKDLLKTNKHKV